MLNHEEIRKALDEATQGPWEVLSEPNTPESVVRFYEKGDLIHEHTENICNMVFSDVPHDERKANAHLIANAPTCLHQLLEENERLKERSDLFEKRHDKLYKSLAVAKHREKYELVPKYQLNTAIKALEFYADENSYVDFTACQSINPTVLQDDGYMARDALYKLKG